MKEHGGFTLVELIVALALMMALTGGLVFSVGHALRTWRRVAECAGRLQIENIVAERICRDIRSAKVLAASSSAEVCLAVAGQSVSYKLVLAKVRRKVGASTAYLTAENEIKRLTFAYPAPGTVAVMVDDLMYLAAGRH